LGLVEEASKYANLLGYNYQSSDWYKKTYGFFNKTYEKNRLKQEKKSKENIVKRKFKSLFE
jgi:outer membrane protein assembly factor BamD